MHWLSVMRLAGLVRRNVQGQLTAKDRHGDSGAVASLVAIFFGTGVLLGLGALVVDTGSLLYERRQLQSGADAAALAVAQDCLKSDQASTLCAAPIISAGSVLVNLAGKNAADTKSDIASVCGSAALVLANPAAFPTVCPTPGTPGLVECPKTTSVGKYVEVRTSTRSGDTTSTILPPILAQTLAGAGNQYSSTTVKACARAAWGKLAMHPPIIPFTPSLCDYLKATPPLEVVPPAIPPAPPIMLPPWPLNPPYGPAPANPIDPAWEIALTFNGASDATCAAWQGHNYPGGFGWLTHGSAPGCALTIPTDHWVQGDTGIGAANDCGDQIEAAVGRVVFLPIFDCMSNNKVNCDNVAMGNNTKYHLYKMAAFYITAVDVTGQIKAGTPGAAAKASCDTKGGKCIYGWFLEKTYEPGAAIEEIGGPLDPSDPSGVQLTG